MQKRMVKVFGGVFGGRSGEAGVVQIEPNEKSKRVRVFVKNFPSLGKDHGDVDITPKDARLMATHLITCADIMEGK